ncbi:MAG: hypothetical protein QOJ42_366 [Acidobacteriaceae bacterium]|nr:hypothetical protein [Acidobacteriaceae bacterium]
MLKARVGSMAEIEHDMHTTLPAYRYAQSAIV